MHRHCCSAQRRRPDASERRVASVPVARSHPRSCSDGRARFRMRSQSDARSAHARNEPQRTHALRRIRGSELVGFVLEDEQHVGQYHRITAQRAAHVEARPGAVENRYRIVTVPSGTPLGPAPFGHRSGRPRSGSAADGRRDRGVPQSEPVSTPSEAWRRRNAAAASC